MRGLNNRQNKTAAVGVRRPATQATPLRATPDRKLPNNRPFAGSSNGRGRRER